MSEASDTGPEEAIIQKILSDGRAQAKRLIDNAVRSAEMEKRKARSQADKIRKEILAETDRRARALVSKEVAAAHIEAKRVMLRAREEAISKVFEAIEHELPRVKEDPEQYDRALRNLAVEAVAGVGGDEVTVKIGKSDEGVAGARFVTDIGKRVEEIQGSKAKIELEFDPAIVGGCVAISKQGRVVFDNTFRRRLERMRPALRSMIVREVLKKDV